ncbi:MAG TPA: DNA-3-methyladenine glycosylase [Rubrobacteraceae bacterium]|nr:DNA-3-methyladenine glycosylase [Rubrobacteraceae bacterium]
MTPGEALVRAFYDRDPRQVAVDLLGCTLVYETAEGVASGVIVETEAYRPEDPACHAYKGLTMRNRTIFGRPGLAYVYLSYGLHKLLNAVCEGEGVGSAVLIRALRPLQGLELMSRRRKRNTHLCDGPGRLTQALGIELDQDGADLTDGLLYILWGDALEDEIVATTRIGISRGTELPWRYLVEGEKNVSVPPKTAAERVLLRRGVRVS